MIKQMIVDVDGVLFNSTKVWEDLPLEFVKVFHCEMHDEVVAALRTLTLKQGIEYIITYYHLPLTYQEANDVLHGLLEDYYQNKVEMKKEVVAFLKALRKKNIKLHVVSSNGHHLLVKSFKKHGIYEIFDSIKTCDEIGYDKRSTKLYEHIASDYDIKPNETMVIEDTYHAIKNAKAVGYHTIGVEDLSNCNVFANMEQDCDLIFYKGDDAINMLEKMKSFI